MGFFGGISILGDRIITLDHLDGSMVIAGVGVAHETTTLFPNAGLLA